MQEVVVKGWRNGLLLILPLYGGWSEVIEQVHTKLDEAKARSFWRGAQTTIDCGARAVTHEELSALMDRIKRGFGLVPIAVVAEDAVTRAAGEKLALKAYAEMPIIKKPFREPGETAEREVGASPSSESVPASTNGAFAPNNALYLPGTVRSGQRVIHDGHLVICGDVNAGAEVMAGGDVVVMGTLRGLAHAGCYGDETGRIVAGSLRPPQLRIATKIASSPEEAPKTSGGTGGRAPEVARIEGGEIVVFPL